MRTTSGETVNNNTALQLGTVFACIRNISEDVAKIPFKVYRPLKPRGKEPAPTHRLYRMLHDSPNSEMTSLVFRQTLTAHCLGWGNGYAEIQRDARGAAVALWPLRPDKVMPLRNDADNLIWYEVTADEGTKYYIRWDNMFHVPGMGFDGRRACRL
jgi:HK97 family phage portal protein